MDTGRTDTDRTGADRTDVVNLAAMLARFGDHWAPRKVAAMNDYDIKVVRALGDFTWHSHPETDEFFLVIDGSLTIGLRERDETAGSGEREVTLGPGEIFVVPRGVEHRPRAGAETSALLIEPRGVVNTGDAGGPLTAAVRDLA
ncbi:MAG: cupin domain-containing protein [Streptosporangiaceae bacterium]